MFGNSEAATHTMSLLFGLLTIPIGMWAGWSLLGKRAGIIAAVLFASNAFITTYSQETRMYSLMVLLGLLATAGFLHAFVYRHRRYAVLFAVAQALMLYTHAWGIFYGAASVVTLLIVYRLSEDRENLLKDAILSLRRRRRSVPPVAAELPLSGDPHGRAVGHGSAVRRVRSSSRAP